MKWDDNICLRSESDHVFKELSIHKGHITCEHEYMITVRGLKSMFTGLEAQILKGTAADASGFSGASDNTLVDTLDDSMVAPMIGAETGFVFGSSEQFDIGARVRFLSETEASGDHLSIGRCFGWAVL